MPASYSAEVAERLEGRRLLVAWTSRVTLGESRGFLAPAIAGVVAVDLAWQAGLALLLGAGAVEGAVLGWAQASVLRRALPLLRTDRWVWLTAGAAVAAYLLGMATGYAGGSTSRVVRVTVAVVCGPLLLVTIGGAQWLELRRHVAHPGAWVAWTAAAWLTALGVFLAIASPLWDEGQRIFVAMLIGAAAGVFMAVTQALVTGWGLCRLLTRGAPTVHRG